MEQNSDWKFDLEIGKMGEKMLGELLTSKKIEVKRDYIAADTGNIAVEFSSRGKPSGIAHTEAEWWAFILAGKANDEVIILIKTERLKEIARIYYKNGNIKEMGDKNTSLSVLIPIHELKNNL